MMEMMKIKCTNIFQRVIYKRSPGSSSPKLTVGLPPPSLLSTVAYISCHISPTFNKVLAPASAIPLMNPPDDPPPPPALILVPVSARPSRVLVPMSDMAVTSPLDWSFIVAKMDARLVVVVMIAQCCTRVETAIFFFSKLENRQISK